MDRPEPAYDEPYCWWGPGQRPAADRSLPELVDAGVLPLPVAGCLAAAVGRRWSLAVVAGPSGAGKTTLLTALLPWLDSAARRFYLRGTFDPFSFLDDDGVEPWRSVILCNEISPHLPVYLWGEGVDRLLAARDRGFQLLATAHANDALGLVRILAGPPLRIRPDRVAGFDLVVALDGSHRQELRGGRLSGLWRLLPTAVGGVEIAALDPTATVAALTMALRCSVPRWAAPVEMAAINAAMEDMRVGGAPRAPTESAPHRPVAGTPPPWRPRRSRPNG